MKWLYSKWSIGLLGMAALWATASSFAAHQLAQRESHLGTPVLLNGTPAPPNIQAIMDRACRDCHSNQTTWPWYAGLPPVSWMVEEDVQKGRKFLNLSQWDRYTPAQQIGYLASMTTSTMQNRMPPQPYRLLHWPANLTDQDRKEIKQWAMSESKRLMAEMRERRKRQAATSN
jgi:hypothetical protein